mgnify:CR=1 FL=1
MILSTRLVLPFLLVILLLPAYSQTFTRTEHLIGLDNSIENNGVAIADYDGDLDLDVFIVAVNKDSDNEISKSKLYRNNNDGSFSDVTAESGIEDLVLEGELDSSYDDFKALSGYKYGASWGDYDNDGFPDLFLTHLAKVHLFKNDGDGTFVDVTETAGILQRNECGNTSSTWFDFNNDGFLDLYINDWEQCQFNLFYENNGDGTFTDRTTLIAEIEEPILASFTAFPYDFNQDGWQDLYVTNDLVDPNQLFINNLGDDFTEDAESWGVDTAGDDMGIAFGDYNLDGLFDVFVTSIDENFLLTNTGENSFTEDAVENNVGASGWGWGATFGDFDLDGDEDLFVVNGFFFTSRGPETNIYYENEYGNGGDTFTEKDTGLEDHAISVATVDFDYDNDGDLDVIVTNSDESCFFYENNIVSNPENNPIYVQWLKILLEGTVSNRSAVGTELTLETTHGSLKRYFTGVGFLSQSLTPVHFGLNPAAEIISLSIRWPSGIVDFYDDVTHNTFIKAVENEGFEVLEQSFAEKPRGCTDPNSCNYDPNAIEDDGSCTYFQASTISGPSNSGFFKTETYSYPLNSNEEIHWRVEGGELLDSPTNNEITVKWGFEETGTIYATVNDELCSSEESAYLVNLRLSNVDDHISVARLWNETTLFAIRNDFARPTVHARNLFHTSAAMYDAWAILNNNRPYLMGNELNGFSSTVDNTLFDESNVVENIETAISFAAFRLLTHRFQNSPNSFETQNKFDRIMNQLGYDSSFTSIDYVDGNAAALGNYIAQIYIAYGLIDQSQESGDYENLFYQPINPPLAPILPGNPTIIDPNRWQSLSLDTYIDQSGNTIEGSSIPFLSPEWGNVYPFAMTDDDLTLHQRNGETFSVYRDAGQPPILDEGDPVSTEEYQWGFALVSQWSAHLDPTDGVMWDISPRSIGNLNSDEFPTSSSEFPQFFDEQNGGVSSQGRPTNPITGQPYQAQVVPRGDYTRVLAEYWADGPDSETPPGHWFTILNQLVNDHPQLIRRVNGNGEELSPLEWDIKAYFSLGGAMHDAAITAWSHKGWYDYVRPISALRYMADRGQSTNPVLFSYHEFGLPLIDEFIELVLPGDELEGRDEENIGKIKVKAWKGHSFIGDTATDQAGVDWILAEQWWPYQRPSFVTPPFAGYVSGHSTYSRAAAELLTEFTGNEFFPGGLGQFYAHKNEFLVFEEGPSMDVKLQWATYRDASDQCSLSRIWGGIHPPIDDIPGRIMGEKVGQEAYDKAVTYFKKVEEEEPPIIDTTEGMLLYPNPARANERLYVTNTESTQQFMMYDLYGRQAPIEQQFDGNGTEITLGNAASGSYILVTEGGHWLLVVE